LDGWEEHRAAPTLRLFAIATPPLILLQIVLGAAYRHKLTGILPHMGGAMIVSIAILVLAMLILQRHPEHRKLCRAATWLISILLAQVALGVTALIMPLLNVSPTVVIAGTALHVVFGSLTLAANVVLAMQVHRSVRRTASASAVSPLVPV
jgi:heme A synthase